MGNTRTTRKDRSHRTRTSRAAAGDARSGGGSLFTRPTLLMSLVLVVASFGVYWQTFSQPFLNYDDPDYVTENPHVQEGLRAHTIAWAVTATDAGNWHPLTWLSHALDCELYGLSPGGHHFSSVVLHSLNTVFLFLFLLAATGKLGRSALVAALFALHPLNVESVAWVAERKNVLSTFFYLLALIAYVWYARKPDAKRYTVVAGLFVLGLASKPMVITFPFVLILLDYWPLGRIEAFMPRSDGVPVKQFRWTTLLAEKVPLVLLSGASAVITIAAQHAAIGPFRTIPLSARLGNVFYSYAMYVARVFWPLDLAPFYPHPMGSLSAISIALSAAFVVGVSGLVGRMGIKFPYLVTGWLIFLGTLVPVIGLVQVGGQGMADRYAYIPVIGIFLMIVWGLADVGTRWPNRSRLLQAASAAVLLGLAVLTIRQLGFWRTNYDLWSHTLEITEDNYVADDGIANILLKQGNPEAMRYFQAAAKATLYDPVSHAAVGGDLQEQGRFQEALHEYDIALRGYPSRDVRAYVETNAGLIYRQLGDLSRAQQMSDRAMRSDPDYVRNRIEQVKAGMGVQPTPQGYLYLGLLLEGARQLPGAREAYEKAVQLDPNLQGARNALARLGASGGG